MLVKVAQKLKETKQCYKFNTTGVAGVCPDCGHIVEFRSYFQEFNCTGSNCAFVANINGERVWDNKKREENLKKFEQEAERERKIENEVRKQYGI